MQATRLIRSRAPAGSMTRAGPVSRTGLAPTGENSFDLRGLACIAQTRQDPERGGAEAAATGIAVISSIGILGGFVSPTLIGFVRDWTGSISGGLAVMTVLIVAGGLVTL